MSGVFLNIVNMSISATWLILAVLILRFPLKKAPRKFTVLLWGVAAVRLVCPFNFESAVSLVPSGKTILPGVTRPYVNSGISAIDNGVNAYLKSRWFEGVTRPADYFSDIATVLSLLWIIGIAALLIYTAVSYIQVKRKVSTAVLLRDNIFQSENVASPFVLGIINPKIYLPFNMTENDAENVIAHENSHIARRDHLWKPLGFLILALHWLNPFVWLGYILLCRDIEFACDEKVVVGFTAEEKAGYSRSLLTCSTKKNTVAACPLAFGEVGVKSRIKSVLNYKKPAFWLVVVAVAAVITVAVCFLTDPKPVYTVKYEVSEKQSDGDEVITVAHYKDENGLWVADGRRYKYRLEISGRMNNAAKDSTFIVLSNSDDISFDETWKASGLGSLTSDYFDPGVAMIVGYR